MLVLYSCGQDQAEPAYPILSTDQRLTSVQRLEDAVTPPVLTPVWQADYYANGRLKRITDARDSLLLADYEYAGQEIIGKDAHTVLKDYRLKVDGQHRVVHMYRILEKDGFGFNSYDTTAYTYDQAGNLVGELRKMEHKYLSGATDNWNIHINHQVTAGNPVLTTIITDFRSSFRPSYRDTQKIIREFYPDKIDQNNIQAFFQLYEYPVNTHLHVPFIKTAKHLLRKVWYVNPDGSTAAWREFSYEWDNQGNVTRITDLSTDPRSTPQQYAQQYLLHYNGQ
jgi:YD repeat-containing protein